MSEQQDKLVEKLTDALNNIGLDIREIKTTLKHFDEKFGQVQKEVSNVRILVGENEHELERLKVKFAREEEKGKEYDASIGRLFKKHEELVKEIKLDRRWLIGTVLSVVGLAITIVSKLLGM